MIFFYNSASIYIPSVDITMTVDLDGCDVSVVKWQYEEGMMPLLDTWYSETRVADEIMEGAVAKLEEAWYTWILV